MELSQINHGPSEDIIAAILSEDTRISRDTWKRILIHCQSPGNTNVRSIVDKEVFPFAVLIYDYNL